MFNTLIPIRMRNMFVCKFSSHLFVRQCVGSDGHAMCALLVPTEEVYVHPLRRRQSRNTSQVRVDSCSHNLTMSSSITPIYLLLSGDALN